MKVGILTYHNTANYGAALQAYATQFALLGLGVDAEIIDYTNEYRQGSYTVRGRFLKQLKGRQFLAAVKTVVGMPIILMRTRNFSLFYRSHLMMSPTILSTMKSLREAPLDYDMYLVGSDQVWNYRNNGADFNYFLDFVSDKSKTASYASSFGVETIPDELRADYARTLSEIRALSVREKKGAALVCDLTGRNPEVVLDPVFLPEREHWYSLAGDAGTVKRPYVLVYTTKADYYNKFRTITKYDPGQADIVQIGTDVSLKDLLDRKVRIRSTVGPEGFLGFIKNANLILTSSFHGTAFAILMERPFVVFLSGDKGRDSRVVDLLTSLGLLDRIFSPTMSADIVERTIDYQSVNKRLASLRAQSINFLQDALQQPCV